MRNRKLWRTLSYHFSQSIIFKERWKALSEEDRSVVLKLLLKKGAFPYEIMTKESIGSIDGFPIRSMFGSVLQNKSEIDEEAYQNAKLLWNTMQLKNINEWLLIYNIGKKKIIMFFNNNDGSVCYLFIFFYFFR